MSLGLAVALIVTSKSENAGNVNLEQYLFGSIVTINMGQVIALFCDCSYCFDFDFIIYQTDVCSDI